jgi:hypothetical protein
MLNPCAADRAIRAYADRTRYEPILDGKLRRTRNHARDHSESECAAGLDRERERLKRGWRSSTRKDGAAHLDLRMRGFMWLC